jgi:EF hand
MRKVTVVAFLVSVAAIVAFMAPFTLGQPGGGGRFGKNGGGGPGGGGGFNANQDPNVLFEFYAKGRSYFLITESRSLGGPLTQYAQEKGITGGQITRQQFLDFYQQLKSKAGPGATPQPGGGGFNPGGGGSLNPGGGGFNPGGGGFNPGGGGMFGKKKKDFGGDEGLPAANGDPTALYPYADADFKKRDQNNDGRLTPEEMPPSLRANLDKWDKNGDKLIDQNEYRAYFVAKTQGSEDAGFQGSKGIASIIIDEEDLDRKPVVYRVGGKMPPGLPDWFKKLDTDNDGQVAMYEWRMAGKSMEEFKDWDKNDDGFITAEEAARHQQLVAKDSPRGSLASNAYDAGTGERPSMGKGDRGDRKGFGGFGGGTGGGTGGGGMFGKGKGNKGKGSGGN